MTKREVWQNGVLVSSEDLADEPVVITPDAAIVQIVQALADPDVTLDDLKLVAADLVTALPDAAP